MMVTKVLWLCNIVIPEFCEAYDIKRNVTGGWLSGMWEELKTCRDLEFGICCPIFDEDRMKDGIQDGNMFFSFPMSVNPDDFSEQRKRFLEILEAFDPDIIHIWGTEYQHSLAMAEACEQRNQLHRVVVNIQGIIWACEKVYCLGLPDYILSRSDDKGKSIWDGYLEFKSKMIFEKEILKKVKFVLGRTDWDEACTKMINSKLKYYDCGEVLRDVFYKKMGKWDVSGCRTHSIFISQCTYPIKGLHLVLKELGKLKKEFPDLWITVAGENILESGTAYGNYLSELIEDNKLKECICFAGTMQPEKMAESYLECNVFLSPSVIENSSNSLCEAMLLGAPVVSSMSGGTPSIIEHGRTGFLYPLEEAYMMKYYVEKIFRDKNICMHMSKRASAFARKKMSRHNNKEKQLNIYKEVMKERKP